jgi:ribosomal protein S12 methylthiotransferase accessory factor
MRSYGSRESSPARDADSLRLYKDALAQVLVGCQVFEFALAPLDRLGLPLWSVAIIGEDGALSDGFGYAPSIESAQTSAWGEAVEWFGARESLLKMPRVHGTFAEMQQRGRAVNPVSLCLSAGSGYSESDTVLEWVAVREYPSGDEIWAPIEFVAPRYADIGPGVEPSKYLAVPITNGSGAGPSFEHALAHGILELLQRDGNCVTYRAMDQGIRIELDDVRDPDTRALLAHLDASGIEVMAKLADDSFGMANLYVVGYDRDINAAPHPIMLSACGEAVHPDREIALAKALREFVSARARKRFNHGPLNDVRAVAPPGYLESFSTASLRSEDERALREMQKWSRMSHVEFFEMLRDPIFAVRRTVKFSELPSVEAPIADAKALLQVLAQRLSAAGMPILYADLSLPGSDISIIKAIVPGLESETMTYQRIGARNVERLMKQDSPIAGKGAAPEGALPILLETLSDAWLDPRAVDAAMRDLYALYREPGRHVIGLLEEQKRAD